MNCLCVEGAENSRSLSAASAPPPLLWSVHFALCSSNKGDRERDTQHVGQRKFVMSTTSLYNLPRETASARPSGERSKHESHSSP